LKEFSCVLPFEDIQKEEALCHIRAGVSRMLTRNTKVLMTSIAP
jgi:hypothetical protein